jgi:hypothetical protein
MSTFRNHLQQVLRAKCCGEVWWSCVAHVVLWDAHQFRELGNPLIIENSVKDGTKIQSLLMQHTSAPFLIHIKDY